LSLEITAGASGGDNEGDGGDDDDEDDDEEDGGGSAASMVGSSMCATIHSIAPSTSLPASTAARRQLNR
jgi:hypothetical protein